VLKFRPTYEKNPPCGFGRVGGFWLLGVWSC
jgi:hypothetical protein